MYKCDKCGKPIEAIAIYYRTHPRLVRYCYDCYNAEQEERKRQRKEEAKERIALDKRLGTKIRNLLRQGLTAEHIAYAFDLTMEEVERYVRES